MPNNAKTAILLILHGSPHEEANEPVTQLALSLQEEKTWERVLVAYMECNEPSIPAAVDICAAEGITQIIAVPWFLHAGRHLVLDVPGLLQESAARHSDMSIKITDPVGMSNHLADALAHRAEEVKKSSG